MTRFDHDSHPDGLGEVVDRLRAGRVQASSLELDRIKTRAMAKAATSRRKGSPMRSRSVAALLAVALMAAGTGGVLAGGGNGHGGGSGSKSQYKPGCGPKKTDGVNPSGTHTGPPGNGPGRTNCPS